MIVWKLRNKSSHIASTRYRCLLPIRWLSRDINTRQILLDDRDLFPPLELVEAIVFVKSFGPRDLRLAQRAYERKIPIIIDICDNIFFEHHLSFNAANFKALAPLAQRIITTNNELAKVIRENLGECCPPISFIEDPLESEDDRNFCNLYENKRLPGLTLGWLEALGHKRSGSIGFALGIDGLWFRAQLKHSRIIVRNYLKHLKSRWFFLLSSMRTKRPVNHQRESSEERIPRVLWFGYSGVPGVHGITDILVLKTSLESIFQKMPFELVVCTDKESLFEQYLSSLKVRTTFVQWSPENLCRVLEDCNLVIVPNPMNEFTKVKSANRTLLALEFGKPVVATPTAALESLKDVVYFSNWDKNLAKALNETFEEKEFRAEIWKQMRGRFESQIMADRWSEILTVTGVASASTKRHGQRVLFVANDRLPTLQICFLSPLSPDVLTGAIDIEILTEAEMKGVFPRASESKKAEAWLVNQLADYQPDYIIFCRYSGPHTRRIVEWARANGIPTIFHIDDDLLAVPKELGEGKFIFHNSPERIGAIQFLVANVDVLYCATTALKDRLRHLRGERATYVGRIPGPGTVMKEPALLKHKRVGCMGIGRGHDLEPLIPVISKLLDQRPDVEFHLFGSTPKPPAWSRFGARVVTLPMERDYNIFRKKFSDLEWSVGLAPIVDIPFNHAKTNLKWLEYTSVGVAVIASRATLYDDCCADGCGILADSPDEWLSAMNFLLDNPEERVAQVRRAQGRLLDQFSTDALRRQVLDVFAIAKESVRSQRVMPIGIPFRSKFS